MITIYRLENYWSNSLYALIKIDYVLSVVYKNSSKGKKKRTNSWSIQLPTFLANNRRAKKERKLCLDKFFMLEIVVNILSNFG